MRTMQRLTQISDGSVQLEDRAARAFLPWVDIKDPSPQRFALSWAILLQSITSDQLPVFELNGDVVEVNLGTHTISPASVHVSPKLSSRHTAVIVGDPLIQGLTAPCALTWTIDLSSQTSVLDSKMAMDESALHNLGEKLSCILQQQASNKQIEQSACELSTLSISNPSPSILSGPSLLHELALGGSHDANNAIEFLSADGNISCLSYRSLDQASSILAKKILHASANQNTESRQMVVPVLLPQSLDLYITWLAILKAGGAFCPLNIDAPADRIEFILQDVAATVLVTNDALASRIPQGPNVTLVLVGNDGLEGQDEEVAAPTVDILSTNLAYVMYTSGSTGRPKGVGISHLAATQSLLAHDDLIPLFNRFLQFASPTFDVSVFEVFFPLMRGATLIGSDREQMLLDISHVMTTMQVDAAELTPTVAGELLRTRSAAPCLKVLLTIGEMLTKHVVEEFGKSETSDGILHGMYGPTEAAIHCTAATHFSSASAVNLIGRPFQTVSAFIMSLAPEDSSEPHVLEPLPLGEIGELVVGGAQLADGYINRPEENAKAFIDSPQYGRLYRTGDKARMSPSGEIECFGRISSGQVKLRGQRIELGEIEHAICRDAAVRAAVAIVSGGSLASFVLVNDKGISDRELRDSCRQLLPRFMVPGEFILVDQFPQLPSGKIDRKALEADYANRRAAGQSADLNEFRDELEKTISLCVSDILGRQLFSDESLVSSGLDSLAAIRLASHLLDAGIRLDVAQVLDADCVDGLWQLSKDIETNSPSEDSQAGLRRIRDLVLNAGAARIEALGFSSSVHSVELCTHIQQAMILETSRDGKAYSNWIELEFQQPMDFPTLRDAFVKLADLNPLLRSGFVEVGLKDHPFARFVREYLDEWLVQKCDTFNYDLDLMSNTDLLYPLRFQVKESKETVQVLIHMHHALYDGWSWQLLLKDLHLVLLGKEVMPKSAYNVLADFLIDYKLSGSSEDSSAFWCDQLQGVAGTPFPNFHGGSDVASSAREATRKLQIPASKLNDVAQNLLIGRQTILQAALCYVLSTYLGSEDVVFGTVFSGRTLPVKGIESMIGPCIRTLPTRMKLSKMQNVTDLLLAIQNMNRKFLEHGILPLQDIKKASGIDFHKSLFDTAFVWQESIWDEDQESPFREVGHGEFLEFALLLEFEPRGEIIHAKATYQNSLLPSTQANLLLEQLDHVASILVNSPNLPINEIGSLLPPLVLSISNPRPDSHVNRSTLVTGVETIAFADPSRNAIELFLSDDTFNVDDLQEISYGELNSRANRFARHLIEQGVAKNDLIAIFLNRSIDSYVSLLALAKIGTGVLPLPTKASSQEINAIFALITPQFLLLDRSTLKIDEDIMGSASRIIFPESLEKYPDDNILTIHDTFHIICTKMTPSAKELAEPSYISYYNIQSHINAISEAYPTNSESKFLQSAPPPSAASIIDVFLTWHTGMTLCLISDQALAKNISQIVNKMEITHLHLTPTLAAHLSPERVPSVRFLLVSGEPLNAKVHNNWAGRGLQQGFESFGVGGVATVNTHVMPSTALGNIGAPLKNTSVFVAAQQEQFSILPHGALGELCFGGDQIAKLVSDSENLGARRFIDHAEFGRLYRSGDHGRLLPDGCIMLMPRRDLAKSNSQSASLEEIDRALLSSEQVHNTTSVVLDKLSGKHQLASVWVPSEQVKAVSDESLSLITQSLFNELISQLPSALVPSYLIPITEIPMTDLHRTDFTKLRTEIECMDSKRLQLFSYQNDSETSVDSFTQDEQTMRTALSAVVGVDKRYIGRNTSFYRLGLDSLSAIAFSRKLQDSGFSRIPVSTILQQSSICQLSANIPTTANGHAPSANGAPAPEFAFDKGFLHEIEHDFKKHNAHVQSVYPCTPLQEAMLAVDSETDLSYFNHVLLRLNTEIGALKDTWVQMMERHEILRTCFRPTQDKRFAFAQIVLEEASLPFEIVTTSSGGIKLEIEKRKSAFERKSPVEGTIPYSLAIFVNAERQERYLLLSIHHALYDGEGIGQLLQEVQLSLSGQTLAKATQFQRFIDYMVSNHPEGSDKFWDRYLSGIIPTRLSINNREVTAHGSPFSSQVKTSMPFSQLKQQCRDASSTPLSLFHAAWARLLALYSDSTDICFGNVFSCRTISLEGVNNIVGPCFNTLPIRIKFSPTSTNTDIMKASQKHNSEILPHQLSALRRVQRRVLGSAPLFDTLLVLQASSTKLDSQYWEILEDEGYMGFPLVCEIIPDETQDLLSIHFHYKTSSLDHQTVEALGCKFLELVNHTIEYPYAQALKTSANDFNIPRLFEKVQSRKFETGQQISKTRTWTYQEKVLRDLLCDFVEDGPDSISLDTTIFQMGLDSINTVQIAGKLRKLGYKISTGDILEAASIEKIASLLEGDEKVVDEDEFDFSAFEKQHIQSVCEHLGIPREDVQSLRPCTPVQNGMLALFTHSGGTKYYNKMALHSKDPLDKTLLKNAWSRVVAQHEMLRTGFVPLPDQQYPFAMITYQPSNDFPWHETLDYAAQMSSQDQKALQNLHLPPWTITVEESSQGITEFHLSALHALYDAQSLDSILSDVISVYQGNSLMKRASVDATLGPILIASQKQIKSSQDFWKKMAPEAHPSRFPDLHPIRNENAKLLSSSIIFSRPLKELETSCREIGVTLQAAAQTAWARLLSAYTGEQKVTFGTVLSGRTLSAEAQEAIFPCLVTMPSPHRIKGTNRELLDRTLENNAALTKNQFTPLSYIQRIFGSSEALFDTLFVYQKFSSNSSLDTWTIVDEETRIDYPVSLELIPYETNLEIRISYRSNLVPEEQAMVILNQYSRLLDNTVLAPDSNSDDYLFLDDQLLSITPAKEKALPTTVSLLHQFVEEKAKTTPDKAAFEFVYQMDSESLQKRIWSYRELDEEGNRVAHYLQSKGVVPGGMVAISFDKCPGASIAILGILKAGCAYLAIDPSAPVSRKQFILEDSNSKIVLCDQKRELEFENVPGVEVQAFDEPRIFESFPSKQPTLAREIQPDDTCYCLYTSGTTGTPKGCEITHDNAVQAMLAFQRLFEPNWDEDSRWLQFASFHFDVSVLEQYWSWSVGICVTSCPRDLLFEDLPGTIQRLQITHIDLTPSLARLVHPDEVPSLCRGVFITGGEQLKQEILDAWGEHGVIYNGYGPTEVTIGCTMLPRMHANDKPSNIGPQFVNVGSYVFHPGTSTPVLRGGVGELCVSGPLVGKGYLNRAELTKERFQELPEYGDRIYRTGDLVRILHDESFQFLGRIDDQVKLRGQRLEIGEINEVIKQATTEVNEVATLVLKHPKQSKDQLVSFLTKVETDKKSRPVEFCFSSSNNVLLSTVKSACQTHLPGYMVPTHIILLTRFPLSANNKADMKVLKGLYEDLTLEEIHELASLTIQEAPPNAREDEIIAVLERFTGVSGSSISSWSSIYELGLDSISVISFSKSLREAGFPQAQSSLIMKHPTVAGMASALHEPNDALPLMDSLYKNAKQEIEAFSHKNFHSLVEILHATDVEVAEIAPCTPLQEGIIYHFLSNDTPMYCSSFQFELQPSIDLNRLESAWARAQSQVQMLRARLLPTPDGYAQVIMKNEGLPWSHFESSSLEEAQGLLKKESQEWISNLGDLSGLLWRISVFTSPESRIMCLNIFHALYDGNSLALLLDLVARDYLDDKTTSEAPEFLDSLHKGPLCKVPAAESFWKSHLANSPSRPLPQVQATRVPIVEETQIQAIKDLDFLKKTLNVTEQAILHTCLLLALHRYFHFVPPLGIVASGRTVDVPGISDVIGPLFNTIPSNIQLHGCQSWTEVARYCHDYHVSTIPFQNTALRDIVKWLGKSPDEPLFETLFVFQRDTINKQSPSDKLWTSISSDADHEYPLAFEITRNGDDHLTAVLATNTNIMSNESAQTILSHFEQILHDFAQKPEQELPYLNGVSEHAATREDEISTTQGSLDSDGSDSEFQWTAQASIIRDTIAKLAGVEGSSVTATTSIFEVGLDSIDAIKLSSRLGKSGIKLPVSVIMRSRNVKAMSGHVSINDVNVSNGTYPLLGSMEKSLAQFLKEENMLPKGAIRVLPATPIQEAMIAEMKASEFKHYYNHEILQVEEHVDIHKLQNAWSSVVKAHPILRTSFVEIWDPEIPVSYAQVVHEEGTFNTRVTTSHGRPLESFIEEKRVNEASDVSPHPLLATTFVVDENDRYLILSISHALYDGWSINLLHEDVHKAYSSEDITRPSSDAILEQVLSSSGERALKFWRAALSSCKPVSFPRGSNCEDQSNVVHRAEKRLPTSLRKAEDFCRQNGVTMQALLVSCWSLLLATYVKQLDVVFGLVLSGRNMVDSEKTMFPTMNTVAMRVILHGTRVELVKYVQETLLDISEHQHFPLRRARPDTRSAQLFDTLFIYQKRPSEASQSGQLLYKSTGDGASGVEYPVCAEVECVGDDLLGRVACRGDLLGQKDTFEILDQMAHILTAFIDDSSVQTVEFFQDHMDICGYSVFQDTTREIEEVKPSERSTSSEWSSVETKIRNVFAIASGVPEETIGKEDTIFQLGLDSISAIKVVALLKKQSVRLTVSDMLRAGSIANMAILANSEHAELSRADISKALDESLQGIDSSSILQSYGIEPREAQAIVATAGQTYFLAMNTLNPEVFYPAFYYKASKQLDPTLLADSWSKLVKQTPSLRTAFLPTKKSHSPYIQVILQPTQSAVVWHDNIDQVIAGANIKQTFGTAPVVLHACETSEGTVLALKIHHALYDAISLPQILDNLAKLCDNPQSVSEFNAESTNDISHLVALRHISSPVDVRRQFWENYLGQTSIQQTDKQVDKIGPIQQFYRPGLVLNMSRIEGSANRQGLSIQSIFLAVYARLHAHIIGRSDVEPLVVGLYLANRSHGAEDLSGLLVPTVNIVPLRLDNKLSEDKNSLVDAARKIQHDIALVSAVEHANVTLMEIAEWTGVRISTCVNFLRLPKTETKDSSVGPGATRVEFRSVQPNELAGLSNSTPVHSDTMGKHVPVLAAHVPPPAGIADVFLPTIDVEAAVREDRLDFGLFAPQGRLSSSTAEKVIEGMRQEMNLLAEEFS